MLKPMMLNMVLSFIWVGCQAIQTKKNLRGIQHMILGFAFKYDGRLFVTRCLLGFSKAMRSNPDIMLLCYKGFKTLFCCDVFPRASIFIVKLMQFLLFDIRLMAIEYFGYFFSTSVQRIALSTVLVENVAICLNQNCRTVFVKLSEMLDELCKHGLINQATHLVPIEQPDNTISARFDLGFFVQTFVLVQFVACKTLYELNISSILKDILTTYDLSHGMSSPHVVDGQCNKVHEVLKFAKCAVPIIARDQDVQQHRQFLANHPMLLQKFGLDIIPSLIQVVNSGCKSICLLWLLMCYQQVGFISANLTCFLSCLRIQNIPSFLAGVLTRKDHICADVSPANC
ncbi:hypothetical protein NC651_014693 [Populus alba x Populus x berolinensis]|nr:hypothetical protein NC651_014693 [Populus alba x Populus x berolinensis]